MTLGATVVLANEAIEAALQLGNAQTGEMIGLKNEKEKLLFQLAVIKKEGGVKADYPSPDEFDKMAVEWKNEMMARAMQIDDLGLKLLAAQGSAARASSYKDDLDQEKEKVTRMSKAVGELQKDNSDLQQQASEYEERINNLQLEIEARTSEVDKLKNNTDAKETELNQLVHRLRLIEQENERLQSKAVELRQSSMPQLESESPPVDIENAQSEDMLSLHNSNDQFRSLQDRNSELEQEINNRTEQIQELLQRIAELEPKGELS